jgi:hypothetical protein
VIPRLPHQVVDTRTLLERPAFALWHDVGLMKSRICIDAVCELFRRGEIDALIAVAPAYARSVWASNDPLTGEMVKWADVSFTITEYCARTPKLPKPAPGLAVVATNYEILRGKRHLQALVKWAAGRRTYLILDESWMVQHHTAQQTRAAYLLRQACDRVTLLNGTPGPPDKTFAQFQILGSHILEVKNWFHFRAKYCVMGVDTEHDPYGSKKIVGYQRMDDFERRTAPYCLRREQKDCLNLPELLPPVTIEARLTPKTWALYKQMRDEFVAWLDTGEAAVARQAGTKAIRMAQMLSGFVGGVEADGDDGPPTSTVREIGREKLDAVMDFIAAHELQKTVFWCRFIPEMDRLARTLAECGRTVYQLRGGQKPHDRDQAKKAFAPGASDDPAAALVGHPAAGGAGLNLSSAAIHVFFSLPFSDRVYKQAFGRVQRPGQVRRVLTCHVVAVGPNGQQTLDHRVVKALQEQSDVAAWTAAMWREALAE